MSFALKRAATGFVVIPLKHGTNIPHPMLGKGWTRDTVGSRDPRVISAWWQEDPIANIGIVTGPRSGVLVLDLVNKIGKPRGIDSIFDLMDEYEPLPETSWVLTPSLARHVYFAWPEGEPALPHVVGLLPGVDVPWQVAVPPSAKLEVISSDRRVKSSRPVAVYLPYEWGQVINPLPVAPAWLLEDIRTRPRQPQGPTGAGGSQRHSTSELPATELFLERGLGWFTGSRDFDCFRLARRMWGQYGDEATVVASFTRRGSGLRRKITPSSGATRTTRSSKRSGTGAQTSRRAVNWLSR